MLGRVRMGHINDTIKNYFSLWSGMLEMDKAIKICFLGYSKLSKMARDIVAEMHCKELIRVLDCSVDTLPRVVDDAIAWGAEVFIAGSSNAAEFRRLYQLPLVEIRVGMIDYVKAYKQALRIGVKPIILTYQYGHSIDSKLISDLVDIPITALTYESESEVEKLMTSQDFDVVIGASFVSEVAEKLGKANILNYSDEMGIRDAIKRACLRARLLREDKRKNSIVSAIIENTPTGIIVCDENEEVTIINSTAKTQLNISAAQAIGRKLSSIVPALNPQPLLNGQSHMLDCKRLINESMYRCTQTRINTVNNTVGVLTTIIVDNSARKKHAEDMVSVKAKITRQWNEIVQNALAMQKVVSKAKKLANSDVPLSIKGEVGTGRETFAECIHNNSKRHTGPYLVANFAIISEQIAANYLFGFEDKESVQIGLIEQANGGTLVIKNLPDASSNLQTFLAEVLDSGQIQRFGSNKMIPVDVRFILTLSSLEEDSARIRPDLLYRLNVVELLLPPLRERVEDIPVLFEQFLHLELKFRKSLLTERMIELLCFYDWPGNLHELNAVAKRFAIEIGSNPQMSAVARQLALVEAIGEKRILRVVSSSLQKEEDYKNIPPETLDLFVRKMKRLLNYNNDAVAAYLDISRTSLWRLQNKHSQ